MALAAQTIITLACQIAKVPSYTSQAGQLLNVILSELCQENDFDVARKTFDFTFNSAVGSGGGPYTLPADYLRAKAGDFNYNLDGVPYPIINVSFPEFDRLVQTAGFAAYPTNYTTDTSVSPNLMYVWPPAAGSYPARMRYYSQMPDIATPETSAIVPWFPSQNYLITRLAGELMKITDDQRCGVFLGEGDGSMIGAGAILRKYLEMKDDSEDRVQTVRLDPRSFSPRASSLRSTKQVW